jgi:hypothetical protein
MAAKVEFASPEWHAKLRELLDRYAAAADPALELTLCEVFTDVPAHLDRDGSRRIAWHCRISARKVDFHEGEVVEADIKTVADYDFVLQLARMKMEEATLAEYRALQAEGAAAGKLNTTGDHSKVPPSFHGMHNEMAEVTA